jgi:hypothetical protein
MLVFGGAADDEGLQDLHPAAAVVQEALEVRASRSADPADYEAFFASSEVAAQLAESAANEGETTAAPTPTWETPVLLSASDATASVEVTWHASDDHPGWPEITEFLLELADDAWVIVDARERSGPEESQDASPTAE